MSGAKDGSVSAKYKYDVFFSLSHQDRNIHTDHFYKALVDAGFRTIRDGDPIDRSEDIKSDLKRAIEQSRISVIILSKNYASSKWCLDQLVMIIDCKRDVILPVFYDVDRFEVGDIKGRIGEAFDRYEEELKVETDDQRKEKLTDKIKRWREALSFAADVPEFVLQNQTVWDESKFIQNIIGAIEEKLKVVQEDFVPMEVETEGGLLNQEASSLVQEWNVVFINLMNIEELPENPKCPVLVKLFLQQSYDLTEIPDSFFESMPVLQVLDLSNTSIKTLPRSIASLVKLREFLLRDCELLRELPTEIGELKNLEVFDLEGTELMCLPKEIGRLLKLECLKVSLCRCADNYIERKGIEAIIPRATLSKFSQLKELRILVDPDCEWWDAEVEAIIGELSKLRNLETLQLYFPTVKLLQKFMKLYQNLSNFRLTVGRHEQQIISSLPRNLQSKFETLDKCLKYVNGKGNADGIGQALEHARALFLDRQWTIEKLSAFKIDEIHRLNFCLVVECNEMDTVVDGGDFYQEGDNSGKPILVWLHYLSLHYMKKLQSIWKGPIIRSCLFSLEILALHTCPELTTIINLALLRNLINLKELIVENCPKVKIIVSAEPSWLEADDDFLPALEKILIVDLPALVSISGVLRIGPKLESIAFSNCPMLKNLSPTDMYSEYMHEIKDESESLEALDSSSSEIDYLHRVFIPLTCYKYFMEQIKRSGKSLYEPSVQNQVGPAQSQWPLLSGDGRRHFGSNMVCDTGVPIFSPAVVTEGPSSLSLSLDEDALFQMNSRSRETRESEPYPMREGEPDCVYYIRTGLCGYGSSCRFNHPPNRKLGTASARTSGGYPERIGQPECQYYLRTGTCKFGYTCKFHHPRDKAGIARRVSLNCLGYPLRPNETECASYLRSGLCKFGSTCKFHHPQPSNMMVPLRGSEWKYSSYLSGFVPIGHSALQREIVFPERPGHPECLSYMKTGDCKFGASCRFHHPRERLIPAPDCVLSPVGLPLRPGEPLCIFYSRYGMCKYGQSCKFDHPMGKEFMYDLSTSPSADVPGPVVRRLLGSSSATDALTLSSEADSAKPRRLSLS